MVDPIETALVKTLTQRFREDGAAIAVVTKRLLHDDSGPAALAIKIVAAPAIKTSHFDFDGTCGLRKDIRWNRKVKQPVTVKNRGARAVSSVFFM